ncbi:MAG: LemA family protein [Bacteroidales bacterium]|nr:LemA family protein [Bacteroidales bacterium]HOY39146.1 LemA family protein [Bacteroidales bacterium]
MNTENNQSTKTKGLGCLGALLIGTPILVILLLLTIWGIRIYNKTVERDETVKKQWSQVETAYQYRYDLIGNLVNVVKGYADFEKSTLTAVIEARSKASSIEIKAEDVNEATLQELDAANKNLNSSLDRLMVVVEQYPNLKADQQFMSLSAELKNTEIQIKLARDAYINVVKDFNAYIRKFPRNLFAKLFGFNQYKYYESDEGAEDKIDVNL